MALVTARDLKEDVLFRASESLTNSKWDAKTMDYLNRVYKTLASGASEFLPEYIDDWWWLRSTDSLILDPCIETGTLALTNGLSAITFSSGPVASAVGKRLRIPQHPDIFTILTHTAGATAATLDQVWTGDTAAASTYQLMKTTYALNVSVQALIGPIITYRGQAQIQGVSPERMDFLYPLARLVPGSPAAFSLETESSVRFSHGGMKDGQSQRVEYRYRPVVVDLTDAVESIPLVPPQWRQILSDMALTLVMMDKNDDRANAIALLARTGLSGMLKENRRRLAKMDKTAGRIMPRQTNVRHLMTESGLIIR